MQNGLGALMRRRSIIESNIVGWMSAFAKLTLPLHTCGEFTLSPNAAVRTK